LGSAPRRTLANSLYFRPQAITNFAHTGCTGKLDCPGTTLFEPSVHERGPRRMKAPRARLRLSPAPELENVVVVNRHTYSGPRDNTFVYIGRGTPLGNQWSNLS